jgi:hypothetical protein
VDGNDPASGFAVAQFIVVTGCSGNLLNWCSIRHAPRQKKNALMTERGFSQEA